MGKIIAGVTIFLLLIVAVKGNAGTGMVPTPGVSGCCQFTDANDAPFCTNGNLPFPCPSQGPGEDFLGFTEGEVCNDLTGQCISPIRNVPTLTETGLLIMAGVFAVFGFLMLRRRKAQA